ncbi:MAG TPA: hypothetical protein VHN13_11055, partial [Candidatus Tectomicrobia bacterium]|nr:hypothetical protein [Candidatus Tectomicrobia bacterium]
HYRTGRYSAYVPERLRERYETAEDDAELLSLRSELALTDARLMDLLARVNTGESGQLWADLRRAHREFKGAKRGRDVARMHTTLAQMEQCIEGAVDDHRAWTEIGELIEQRLRLAESEAKRMASLHQMMTKEEALLMAHQVIDIMTRHVTDKQVLSAVIVDMQRLVGPAHALPAYGEDSDG